MNKNLMSKVKTINKEDRTNMITYLAEILKLYITYIKIN